MTVRLKKTIWGDAPRWTGVEGSTLGPLRPVPNNHKFGKTPAPLPPHCNDPEYLHEIGTDAFYDITIMPTRREIEDGFPMADFECPHGHLPIDSRISCDCWGADLMEDLTMQLNRVQTLALWGLACDSPLDTTFEVKSTGVSEAVLVTGRSSSFSTEKQWRLAPEGGSELIRDLSPAVYTTATVEPGPEED